MMRDVPLARATIETIVTGIWEAELCIPSLQAESDFFEFGGDSLKMLNMLFQVGARLGVDLPPGVLFENPSLQRFCAAVALAIEESQERDPGQPSEESMVEGGI